MGDSAVSALSGCVDKSRLRKADLVFRRTENGAHAITARHFPTAACMQTSVDVPLFSEIPASTYSCDHKNRYQ